MKSKLQLVFLAIALSGIVCCKWHTEMHFPERTFNTPWTMDTKTLERLKLNVNAVDLGDDIAQVVKRVGVPDGDYTVKKNDKNRFLTYYATRQRADSRIESDKVVVIALNDDDKVKAIFSNIDGITTRNWPQ